MIAEEVLDDVLFNQRAADIMVPTAASLIVALAAAGFVVVPREATSKMIKAACADGVTMPTGGEMRSTVVSIWNVMIKAAQ